MCIRDSLYTEEMPAAFNEDTTTPGLFKNGDATDEEFADYLKNITSVTVNGKAYAASGRGAVVLFNEDGSLKTDAAPFAEGDSFEITVSSLGYQDLSFTWKKSAEEPDELAQAVEKVLSDQTIVPQVVKFIRQYKTKQGINNALNKEFKDSKRTSEIYSAIKPLIADKKGK